MPLFLHFLTRFFSPHRATVIQTLTLALPIIMGQLGIVLMGVADTLMVGHLGKDVLAAANQANSIFFMVSSVTFGVMFAISSRVSIQFGEGLRQETFATYRAGQLAAMLLFLCQFTILEIIIQNFEILGQAESINKLTPGFLRIINYSALPMLLSTASRQYTDGLGHTKVAMSITFGGLALNVLLNYGLIYGNIGMPNMGMYGAAWATLIARIGMALAGIWYIRYSGFLAAYRPQIMPSMSAIKVQLSALWKLGLPVGLQTFAEWACFSISGLMVGWLGTAQVAAHAVALNVASVAYMVVSGLAVAGSILAGNAYGEKNKAAIQKVAHATFYIIVAFQLVNVCIFVLFNKQISNWYGVEPEVMPIILPLFFLAAVFQLADGVQAGAMNLLRGITDVKWSSIISVFSYWIISLPASYILGITLDGKVFGIWTGFTLGLFVAAGFGVWRFYHKLKILQWD
jgi:MATE family multidrug resistance protein